MARRRIGIIGYGKIARDRHEPAIRGSDAFELAAVSNAAEGPTPGDVRAFAGYAEMLRAVPGLDAVAVCTPPGPRRAVALDALAAGLHVLLEKPPAATLAEAEAIGAAAGRAGRVAFAAYHAQHNAAVARAAERLSGRTVRTLRVVWKEDVRRWHPGQEWVFRAGGFGVFDPGINALSILTRILPAPLFVRSATLSVPKGREAPIAADLRFGMEGVEAEDALQAAFDWRQAGEQTWDIHVETRDGMRLSLTHGGRRLQFDGEAPVEGPDEEYADIYRDFAGLLDQGRSRLDATPLRLVADSFLVGERREVEAFTF